MSVEHLDFESIFPDGDAAKRAAIKQFGLLYKEYLTDREGLVPLMTALKSRFYISPNSTSTERCGCFEGGLICHSVNVTQLMMKMRSAIAPSVSEESTAFVGMFHVLGKVGSVEQPYFLQQSEDWKKNKGWLYEINSDYLQLTPAQQTLQLLNRFGVKVSDEEWQALTFQDGQYSQAGKQVAHKEEELTLLLNFAKYWSTHVDGL